MKCAFICVYLGKLPNYFSLWLESCSFNMKFDWLLFIDDHASYEYPSNVKVYYTSWEAIKKRFQDRYDFPIRMDTPYKLCDYRPAYGELFEKELKQYNNWGHCDLDLVWGKLSKYITDDLLQSFDKLYIWGHCSLYRNIPEIITGYRKFGKINGIGYREVFMNPKNMVFDESGGEKNWGGVNALFQNAGMKVYKATPFDDIKIAYNNLCSYRMTGENDEFVKNKSICRYPAAYAFDNGILKQYLLLKNHLCVTESMYVHFQKRMMEVCLNSNKNRFLMIPNKFIPYEEISPNFLVEWCAHKSIYWHYINFRASNFKKKIKCYFRG